MKKKLTILLALLMVLGMCSFGFMPVAAAETPMPSVTNGAGSIYLDNGITVISEPTNVFITADPGTSYYYLINDTDQVGVYYVGETDKPVGSYFDGSLVNSALVTTLGPQVSKYVGFPVNTIVTIPAQSSKLTVIAYKDDIASAIYSHTFRFFKADYVNGRMTATVDTEKDLGLEFGLYIAAYKDNGALAKLYFNDFTTSGTFNASLLDYPLGNYSYKAFWWNKNYVPLAKEKRFE